MNVLDLPDCMLLEIFEYLTYDEVSKNRLVCRRINQVCQQVLNGGFNKAVRQHSTIFKRIKALLPRRESERRNHSLARHADILTSIETRISMLSMTYSKYMDLNLCCFIPGRVLDEIFRILALVSKTRKTLRPHEVLQELRDISSMAIEHFDEKIANILKPYVDGGNSSRSSGNSSGEHRRTSSSSGLGSISFSVSPSSSNCWSSANTSPLNVSCNAGCSSSSSGSGISGSNPHCCESIRQRVNNLLNWSQQSKLFVSTQWNEYMKNALECSALEPSAGEPSNKCEEPGGCSEARATMIKFKKLEMEYKNGVVKMNRMQQIQMHQARRLQQSLSAVADMNTQIVELKKRLEDLDAKNREISANIKQINPGGEPVTPAVAPLATAAAPAASSNAPTAAAMNCDNEDNDDDITGTSTAKKRRCERISERVVRKRKAENE